MSTPRQELPRRHARTPEGRDLEHGDAVVRQRLRAVTGRAREDPVPVTRGGRPALAWQPATAAFPHVEQRRDDDPPDEDLGAPAAPAGPGPGWLPSRPADNGGGDDDLALRLRSRAATTVASAYTAAHGHPTAHSGFAGLDDGGRRRWAASPRVAVTALVVVLALGAAVAVTSLRADDIEPLVPVGSPGTTAEAVDDDVAAPGAGAEQNAADGPDDPAGDVALVTGAEAPGTGVVVHVVGQVVAPGLVTVAPDARVADALDAAGGATPAADLGALNLARTVADGEQIVVPRPGEVVAAPPGPAGSTTGGATGDGDVVDLNTADATTLDALPGIGPVLAERIVAWRDENGPYTSVDELGEVSGIGPAVLADVRDLVRV